MERTEGGATMKIRIERAGAAAMVWLFPLLGVALAGCGAADAPEAETMVRDSAGITIVENADAGIWQEDAAWRLGQNPAVRIGVLEGAPEYQLYGVNGAARLSDGRIVVANTGSHELRFYDADGRYLQAVGAEGEGPGEFQRISSFMVLGGDSLLVHDGGLQRVSVFASDGTLARSFPVEPPGEIGFPYVTGRVDDQSLLLRMGSVFMQGEVSDGLSRDSALYLRYDMEGELLDTIGTFIGSDSYVQTMDGGFSVTSLPFGRSPSHTAGDGRFYFGTGDSHQIGVYSPEGDLQRLIRVDRSTLAVTSGDIEQVKQQRLENASSDSWRTRLENMFAEMPFPDSMPAYSSMQVDAGGNLWVAAYLPPGDDDPRWSVFDPDGRLLGEVHTPDRFHVYEIGSDYLLGSWRDEYDVEYVQLYDLLKPGSEIVGR